MADRVIQPPPDVMIPELLTPDHTNTFFRELVSRESPRFQANSPIKRGVLYSSLQGSDVNISKQYPLLYFCKETVPTGSNTVAGMNQSDWVIWNWSVGEDSESTFNAEISYLGDATGNPVFARRYTVRRDDYEADPFIGTGLPLTALIGVKITNGGSSYTHAKAIFDCNGEDADIDFVIADGVIISGIVTAEGRNFDAGSIITIDGDGSGATCEAIIQPVEAILTSQKKMEFPAEDPMGHEFVQVLRVYEVLPGPWIPFTRYDENLGPIQGRRRAVLNTGQLGGVITPTSKTNYEGRDGSSVVSIEIQEMWSDGTGTDPNNPPYPFLCWSTYTDNRGTVDHTSQIIAAPYCNDFAELVHTGNKALKTWFEPYADNPFLKRRMTESWNEPIIDDQEGTSEHGGGVLNVTERTAEPGVNPVVRGLLVASSDQRTITPNQQVTRNKVLDAAAWPVNHGFHTDETTGIVVNFTKQTIDAGLPYPGTTPQSDDCSLVKIQGPFIEDQPYDDTKTIRIISAVDLNTLPKKQCWPILHPVNFPPQLLSIEAIWTDFKGRTTSVSPGDVNTTFVQVNSGSNGGVAVTAKNGFRGYAKGRQERSYFYGPPNPGLVPTAYQIRPTSGSVVFMATSSTTNQQLTDAGGVEFHDEFHSQSHAVDIGEHLVGVYDITSNDPSDVVSGNQLIHTSPSVGPITATPPFNSIFAAGTPATMTVVIPQSVPTMLFPGQEIIMEVHVQEHPFGIWTMDVIYVTIP